MNGTSLPNNSLLSFLSNAYTTCENKARPYATWAYGHIISIPSQMQTNRLVACGVFLTASVVTEKITSIMKVIDELICAVEYNPRKYYGWKNVREE